MSLIRWKRQKTETNNKELDRGWTATWSEAHNTFLLFRQKAFCFHPHDLCQCCCYHCTLVVKTFYLLSTRAEYEKLSNWDYTSICWNLNLIVWSVLVSPSYMLSTAVLKRRIFEWIKKHINEGEKRRLLVKQTNKKFQIGTF